MVRAAYIDKNGLTKGAWNQEEDNKLRAYILKYGHWNWRLLPKYADLQRCGKSCRLRWMNYLKPGVKRGNYTKEEEDLIRKLHHELGNKWSTIAAKLPGRSDNEIKNHWHAHLNKRCAKTSSKSDENFQDKKSNSEMTISSSDLTSTPINSDLKSSVEGNCSPGPSNSLALNWEAYNDSATSSSDPLSGFQENFWTEPFALDKTYSSLDFSNFLLLDEDGFFSTYLTEFPI